MSRVSRAGKTEETVLLRARAAAEHGDVIRPLRGELAAVRRLHKRGLLVEAGVSVVWPYVLFALSKQEHDALKSFSDLKTQERLYEH